MLKNKTQDVDYLFKIVFVGYSGVGKSSLIRRFTEDSFSNTYLSTIGVDFRLKSITYNNKLIKLQIWDTAGQERFRTITSAYYRGARAVAIVYDVTNKETFNNLKYWIDELHRYVEKKVPIIIIGNKTDLIERVISNTEAKEYADLYQCMYVETSAKDNTNVNEIFTSLVSTLMKDYDTNLDESSFYKSLLNKDTQKLLDNNESQNKTDCIC